MRKISLIPRLRVNYTFIDLLSSLFVHESSTKNRDKCLSILSELMEGENICFTPSGRDALYELLIRLPQQKVIVPAYTCIAVVEAVALARKDIVYCKTDPKTFNSNYIECITPDCIVLATHQYGLPCNINEIAKKCEDTGAILIEDCATSLGTTVNGKQTGTFGDYAILSFNASKLLHVPPYGGALVGKNSAVIEEIRSNSGWRKASFSFKVKGLVRGLAFVLTKNKLLYRCFHYLIIESKGKHQRTEHETPETEKTSLYKWEFAEWQAFILLKQLTKLRTIFHNRIELFSYYDSCIKNNMITKPLYNADAVCCRYAILVNEREKFYKACIYAGVDLDFSHCSLGCPDSFTVEHHIANTVLNIPFDLNLSNEEKKQIVSVINSIR